MKMSRTTFIVLSIVSYVFFPVSKIDALPVAKNGSILDEIKSDKEICETRSIFYESRFANSCQHYNFPTNEKETIHDGNTKQFLCLGLYQRIYNLCFLSSLSKQANNTELPENSKIFDAGVEKSFPTASTNVTVLCTNWKHASMSNYSKIINYVVQLEKVLSKPIACLKMCSTFDGELEPLCALLASMDGISNKLQSKTKKIEPKEKEGVSKDVDVKDSQGIDPELSKKKVKEEQPESKTMKESKAETNGAETAAQKIEADEKSETKQQTNPTSNKKPTVPGSQKPETIQPADAKADTVQEPKETSIAKQNLDKATQAIPKPVVADKKKDKPTSSKNVQGNPETGENQVPAHDNSQEDFDKNPAGIEQDDENADVISQHTQDDDITVDRRPSEDANEIESPIEATHEEDANENPAQPQEKYSYVPHSSVIQDDDDSHFFGYFTVIGVICIAGYVGYHNKQKILAMVLEGRRSRGGRGRRRPSTANYRKLDCTLEEAVTSQCNSNVTHVIY